jgi:Sulfotransferase family
MGKQSEKKTVSEFPLENSSMQLDQHDPLFIYGCPRSGTTFLANCIGALDNVEMFKGVLAPARLMHLLGSNRLAAEDQDVLLWSVRDIFWKAFWNRRHFPSERLHQTLKKNKAWKNAFYPTSFEKFIFAYKQPFAVFAAKELAEHFSTSKFIHIIRDGRDSADSIERKYPHTLSDKVMQNPAFAQQIVSEIGIPQQWGQWYLPWWLPENDREAFVKLSQYGRYIWLWREMVERGKSISDIGDSRYLEIRYEELVQDPLGTGQIICKFLNTEPNKRFEKALLTASTNSVGIHTKTRSPEVVQEANDLAFSLFQSLNYL